ncbi:MAG: hydroxyacid dehydrogenase [Herminiimonas sp.]|nr:hydroxyacid dehydrogenase [Herminiimonas sp.]
MKIDILQVGAFPPPLQAMVDAEFECHSEAELAGNDGLRNAIRGIITRSAVKVPATLVESLPNLQIISTSGVGYDLIPRDVAAKRGIVVTNTPDVLNTAVAELCVGLVLSLLRRIPEAHRYAMEGKWAKAQFSMGSNLSGKEVGIVGLGRIGKEIARRLNAFDVKLSYFGRNDQKLAYRFEPDIKALARSADILIVAAPGGDETSKLIDGAVLEALGPQGYLVNMARGTLVDEAALLDALANRRIAGAGLDVFENEPNIDARFLALENVVLTPHIASATNETRRAMMRLTLDNLQAFFGSGKAVTEVVAD